MNVVGGIFDGIGLLAYGLHLAGWRHAFLCESEPDRRAILSLRFPGVPIYSDVREVDRSAPRVDLLAGGFPCKGGSSAGNRAGLDHPETALWRQMARVIGELRPKLVLIENVANLLSVPPESPGRAWGDVLGDLAALGYVCAWDCLPAAAFGAPHGRDRIFCVAADAREAGWAIGGERTGSGVNGARRRGEPQAGPASDADPGRCEPGIGDLRPRRGQSDAEGRAIADSEVSGRLAPEPAANGAGLGALARGRSGVRVEWGPYESAVHRWETILRPAPEPLLCGVDARDARRVVRSRLSALGDGVQLQAGYFLGRQLMKAARMNPPTVHPPSFVGGVA